MIDFNSRQMYLDNRSHLYNAEFEISHSYLSILLDECPALARVDLGAAVGAQFDPERAKLVIVSDVGKHLC